MQLHILEYLIQFSGKKFDPDGSYTKKYLPELKNMPNEYLFNPWEAPAIILKKRMLV